MSATELVVIRVDCASSNFPGARSLIELYLIRTSAFTIDSQTLRQLISVLFLIVYVLSIFNM